MSNNDAPRCPCGTDLPAAEVCALRSPVIVRRPAWMFWAPRIEVMSVITGYRYACQAKGCGMIYSVGPRGTFVHDRAALPYMAAPDPDRGRTVFNGDGVPMVPEDEDDDSYIESGPPIARERSRV